MSKYHKRFFSIILIIVAFANYSCNTHYGYRSKVRVQKNEQVKPSTKNDYKNNRLKATEDISHSELSASLDSSFVPHFPQLIYQPLNDLEINLFDSVNLKSIDKPKEIKSKKSNVEKAPKTKPKNYYSKWAIKLGLFSLLIFPLVLPGVVGPLTFFLGRKALKDIKKNGEGGRAMALIGIIIGILFMALFVIVFCGLILVDPTRLGWLGFVILLFLLIFILDLVIYKSILKSPKNPASDDSPEFLDSERNKNSRIFLIVLLSLMILADIIILFIMRAFRA